MSDLTPFPWFDVVIILALIALNGALSMSELAIVSSREARLKAMAKSGSGGAQCALQLASDPGRFLSTVQIGITLVGILAGAYSGAALGGPVGQRIATLGIEPDTAETVGFAIVIVLTTFASVVIGEIVPKQFALRSPEPIAATAPDRSELDAVQLRPLDTYAGSYRASSTGNVVTIVVENGALRVLEPGQYDLIPRSADELDVLGNLGHDDLGPVIARPFARVHGAQPIEG